MHRLKLGFIFLVVLSTYSVTDIRAAAGRAMTIEDLITPVRVSEPALSPDGRTVLFTRTTTNLKDGKRNADIWSVAADGSSAPKELIGGDKNENNARFLPDGRVVFTDWEAAESCGMPLWDLLYFLRSYAMHGRRRGLQSRLETFGRHFLGSSPLSEFIQSSVDRYVERVGVPPNLIEPIFHTCWMHRALKEASRLAPQKLDDGRFVQESEPFHLSEMEVFYDRQRVSRFVLSAALSDNPLITFKLRARPGVTVRVTLTNTRGQRFEATHLLRVG